MEGKLENGRRKKSEVVNGVPMKIKNTLYYKFKEPQGKEEKTDIRYRDRKEEKPANHRLGWMLLSPEGWSVSTCDPGERR